MKIAILDTQTLGNTSLEVLTQLGELMCYPMTLPEQTSERIRDVDVVITNKVILDKEILEAANNLKLVCIAATGTNNVDLAAAKSLGIAVCNVAGYSTPSVVQHTFTLLGNLMTNMHRYIADCQLGRWQQSDMFCRLDYPISELQDKTFVVVGYGSLGQAVASVAQAFGANVIIAEQKSATSVREGRVAFNDALVMADVVSIHCPLNSQTQNLISTPEFNLMKHSAFIVNTARGGIVDEAALVSALEAGQIAGAALDVLSKEPAQQDNPLCHYQGSNLLLTPHTAWASQESITRLVNEIAKNIMAYNYNEPRNRVV
ncbi:D-2-hydroxyacid dehydrogenase [Pseudoalteromonas xiamenensis]|uniref:D-2-hydroxyacid dehydrogenase n=1 Tax=Pseudoalteromonas xiamenensis TaxID=882626 RepID=A0A975DFM5_9GAMM|nr:D-2-hydroxyacid dehydrogenase [Pseudoalteromonas xiamenensis]QTH70847.1 D-2-hydroxyacid dehydrogenase [Pseudoalteromonas xiamenensis]